MRVFLVLEFNVTIPFLYNNLMNLYTTTVVKEFESGSTTANNSLQTCIAVRDQSEAIMRNSEPNIILTSQLSR